MATKLQVAIAILASVSVSALPSASPMDRSLEPANLDARQEGWTRIVGFGASYDCEGGPWARSAWFLYGENECYGWPHYGLQMISNDSSGACHSFTLYTREEGKEACSTDPLTVSELDMCYDTRGYSFIRYNC